LAAEEAWTAYREQQCDAEVATVDGASGLGEVDFRCRIEVTQERIELLHYLLR